MVQPSQHGALQLGCGCRFQAYLETQNVHGECSPGSPSPNFSAVIVSGWWRSWLQYWQAFLWGGSGCSTATADTHRRWLRSACVPITYGWAMTDCKHHLYCTGQLETFKPLLCFYGSVFFTVFSSHSSTRYVWELKDTLGTRTVSTVLWLQSGEMSRTTG